MPVIGWAALALGAVTPLAGMIARSASAALGRDVTIDGPVRLLITPFSLRVTAANVRIANPDWADERAFLDADRMEAALSTFDLLIGRPGIRSLALRDARIDLERSADGKQNKWTAGAPGTLFDLATIRHVDADRVTLRYRDGRARREAELALRTGGSGVIEFSGAGSVGPRAFTLAGSLQSAEDRPAQLDMRGDIAGIALGLRGTMPAPFRPVDARLTASASGRNFAELAQLAGISLPDLPDYALSARLGKARKGWYFSHVEGRIGGTDLAGKLTLDQRRDRPLVVAQLASQKLDLADARLLFALRDDAADGSDIDEASPRLLPDAPLSRDALRGFDAVVDYSAGDVTGTAKAPTHVAMKLALVDGMLRLSPATIDLAGGFVSSDIFVDARRSPALVRADIRLSPTPMGRLLADWGIAPAGTTAMIKGRIQLAGRGETLREAIGRADGRIALVLPAGDVHIAAASASPLDMANLNDAMFQGPAIGPAPADLNCGLIAFTVRQGLATADPILIDTDRNILSGSGELDLRDETLDLRLSAQGKGFALFGRPGKVRISGTLADPVSERERINWFRPASLFGLSMLLPDFRAILGFVDPDAADAPACGPILQGAPAAAQRARASEIASLR